MCGLAVFLSIRTPQSLVAPTIIRMLECMRDRGPDDAGLQVYRNIGLGHRLLRILPCANSTQPIRAEDDQAAITFNGEIYNFRELRADLVRKGTRFRTNTDTETALALYQRDGPDFLKHLKGMFAIAIHDRRNRTLILARDRFGQKPLYIWETVGGLIAASSIRALLAAELAPPKLSTELLPFLFTYGDCPNYSSLIRGIRHVPPGHALVFSEDGTLLEKRVFARSRFHRHHDCPDQEDRVDHVSHLLARSTAAMTLDVSRPAAHLSGGLDSGLLVSELKKTFSGDLATYSCNFDLTSVLKNSDEAMFDERTCQGAIVHRFNVENNQLKVRPEDILKHLFEIVAAVEEPKGNPCTPHFMLARDIAKRHRVIYSGEGADELFGGYTWKLAAADADNYDSGVRAYAEKLAFAEPAVLDDLLAPLDGTFAAFENYVRDAFARDPSRSLIDKSMNFEIAHFLHYLLLQADKLSGHFGMEARYIYLHDDLADYMFSTPESIRYNRNRPAKPILRSIAQSRLPHVVMNQPKIGFVAPEGSWYRSTLREVVLSLLTSSGSRITDFVAPAALRRILADHFAGRRNFRKLIWSLVSFEIWQSQLFKVNVSSSPIREIDVTS